MKKITIADYEQKQVMENVRYIEKGIKSGEGEAALFLLRRFPNITNGELADRLMADGFSSISGVRKAKDYLKIDAAKPLYPEKMRELGFPIDYVLHCDVCHSDGHDHVIEISSVDNEGDRKYPEDHNTLWVCRSCVARMARLAR